MLYKIMLEAVFCCLKKFLKIAANGFFIFFLQIFSYIVSASKDVSK